MADPSKAVRENVPGAFFVDSTCIDCDTCRQLAPRTFAEAGEHSYVAMQPQGEDLRAAFRALVACPTASIGTLGENLAREAMAEFPLALEPGIAYLGFASRDSYGGSSYLAGSWMIDAPRYHPALFTRIEKLEFIFLTHRDDVADAARYAAHFKAKRVIHEGDLDAMPDAEIVLRGDEPVELAPGFLAIPTPGHTRGHCVLLHDGVLFSGDHLAWDRAAGQASAHRDVCWYSWEQQRRSMERLLDYEIRRVLPGHGQAFELAPAAMRAELAALVGRM
ncbi:MAG: beta-lactamase domain protein [Cyanobacteria bacterium RYN_339]|nr:beta-lactamase domain protein [Cyanobacteria bacterium RYN_339]